MGSEGEEVAAGPQGARVESVALAFHSCDPFSMRGTGGGGFH